MKPMTEAHLAILRRHMVEIIDMHFDLAEDEIGRHQPSPRLRQALLETPRHLFVPAQLAAAAYQDSPLPIGFDKTVSQPFVAALMLELLQVEPGQRVLEVGTGLGYQAALMAAMGATIFSVEIVEEFGQAARLNLASIDHDVEIRIGDGSRGWAEHSPFDRILVTAASGSPPQPLLDQLAPGGLMVIPVGSEDVQQLSQISRRDDGTFGIRSILPVRFTRLETA